MIESASAEMSSTQAAGDRRSVSGILRALSGSRRVDGSGAPRVATAVAAVVVLVLALGAGTAFASKGGDSLIGQTSAASGEAADGGLFNVPRDIAVNQDGTGGVAPGTVYVADQNNHRIQRLDADGDFELAWGRDVVTSGAPNDVDAASFEVCDVTHPTTPNSAADCKAGTTASPALGGFLDSPSGVAVDQDTGDVYVADRRNFRVQHFDAHGNFVRAWGWDVIVDGSPSDPGNVSTFQVCTDAADCKAGTGGSGEGQFSANDGSGNNSDWTLDVSPADGDPTTGKVVVADPGPSSVGNRRAQIFDLEDLAAEDPPSAGDGEIVGGGSTGPFSSSNPRHVAIDSSGVAYAVNSGTASVLRYDTAAGSFLSDISGQTMVGTYPGGLSGLMLLEAMGIDPVSGKLFVTANPTSGTPDTVIYEFDDPAAPDATPSDFHMRGSGNQATNGLGVLNSGSLDRLYVSASGGAIGHRILILDEDGAQPAASADIEPASAVGAHEATLHGTVNPNGPTGFPTSYRFEYSEDGIEWTPASAFTNAGDGSAGVDASTTIGGLEANTFYRVRLVTERTFDAGSTVSPELTFLTDSPPPEVQTGPVRHRTATTVQFTGQINPNNLATTYYFEYGPTDDFGFEAPIPDGDAGSAGVEKALHEGVEGLEAGTTYHYRLVATNAQGKTEGASRTFTTRAGATPPAGRAYEMVTPADKASRRTGEHKGAMVALANPGTPAPDGDSLLFRMRLGFLDSDAGTAFPHIVDTVVTRRGADGWKAESVNDVVADVPATVSIESLQAMSADLETQAWFHRSELFPSGSSYGTKVFGDTGGLNGSGWYDWISDPALASTVSAQGDDAALISDGGERMLRWGAYRGLLGSDDPSHPDYPDAGNPDHPSDALTQLSGHSVYFQQPAGPGDRHLVNECTGTGADATVLPDRDDNGTAIPTFGDDKIGFQTCEDGSVTSRRGATVGAGGSASNGAGTSTFGPTARAMSEDGKRVFFMSPDPRDGDPGAPAGCEIVAFDDDGNVVPGDPPFPATASGEYADCAPQLFVRQYDSDGEATVRWISQSEVARGNPDGQQVGLMDGGAVFQGASADGRYVFFKTKAPLVEGDPNGAGSPTSGGVTTGSASNSSWDVYRYELPASVDSDPDEGELLRISGGPSGVEDPNTNSSGGGNGSSVRYVSQDGKRAYFVTGAPIGDTGEAWNQPPSGGVTVPGGTVSNSSTRNLYLYDENETGDDRWRFVAQIPFAPESTVLTDVANCASAGSESGRPEVLTSLDDPRRNSVNCVRGTPDGSKIVFETPAQLTEDDTDSAVDIYVYDADADELTRISAPPLGATPYGCDHESSGELKGVCNADLGFAGPPASPSRPGGQEFVGTGGRYQDNLAVDASGELSVFFESRVPLVAEDTNGDRMDTYQWRAGELSLISPGDSDHDAWYSGNSADGRDVFFFTSQRISPWEIDQADFDLYDARVGGGFAPPPPRPAGCDALADGCQSAGGGSPTAVSPRTTTGVPGGAGNASPGERVRLRAVAPGRRALRRAARTGVVRIRVRSSAPGTVRALARARLRLRGGRRAVRIVARGRVRVRKAGRRVVALRLNHRARRELARGRGLRLVVRIGQPGARPAAVRMGLRRAGR